MLHRVKVRLQENFVLSTAEILAQISAANVSPADILETREGVHLLFSSDSDLEKIFTTTATTTLQDAGITLTPPRRYLADRTVFARNITTWITDRDDDDILCSINDQNPTLTAVAVKTISNAEVNRRPTLKVTFTTAIAATHATDYGLKCAGITIPPTQVTMERFTELRQCFKCYQYSHYTRKCTERAQKCSLCAQDHHYTDCTSSHRRCLLCNGPHSAVSPDCLLRQEEIQKMITTASSTTIPRPANPLPSEFPFLPGNTHVTPSPLPGPWGCRTQPTAPPLTTQPPSQPAASTKITILPVLLHLADKIAGNDITRYIHVINRLLVENGLPTAAVPDDLLPASTTATGPSAPDASLTAFTSTPQTTTRSTTRSISTQTEPHKARAAQTEVFPSPAPNTPTITISADALADVLSTCCTTNAPKTASTTNPRHLSLPQAARRKTKSPATDVTDSSDEEILVGAPLPHHKCDTYSVQDLLKEATSPNSVSTAQPKSQPKKKQKT